MCIFPFFRHGMFGSVLSVSTEHWSVPDTVYALELDLVDLMHLPPAPPLTQLATSKYRTSASR
jgi:hypothetical protein